MFLDGGLELLLIDLFVTVGINHLENLGDILSPSSSKLDTVLLGKASKSLGDLLKAPFSIIVGINGVEDGGFDLIGGDFT